MLKTHLELGQIVRFDLGSDVSEAPQVFGQATPFQRLSQLTQDTANPMKRNGLAVKPFYKSINTAEIYLNIYDGI